MKRIFVSYSMKDQPNASEALRKWLERQDEPRDVQDPFVWAASDRNVSDVIRERIGAADAFVAVWTEQAPKSPWVLYELGMAHALGRPITILLAGGEPSAIPGEITEADIVEPEPLPA